MSSQPIHHAHRPIGHPDILDAIIDICKEERRYNTIVLIALMSKHHHAIVRPHLKRIRKRVVLDLNEFAWRDKDNDGHIEIVLCDKGSPLPVELGDTTVNAELQSRLKPDIAIWRGRPWRGTANVWTGIFPSISLLVISEDSRHALNDMEESDAPSDMEESEDDMNVELPSSTDLLQSSRDCLYSVIQTSKEKLTGHKGAIRYRFHQSYRQLVQTQPGQRFYQLNCQTNNGRSVLESDVWLSSLAFPPDDLIKELGLILPIGLKCSSATLDAYVQLTEPVTRELFTSEEDPLDGIPIGYQKLSNMAESLALRSLKPGRGRMTFRLFILRHDDAFADRADMQPIYSTTCAVDGSGSPVVIKRDYDEDFAGCITNGGCRRCRG